MIWYAKKCAKIQIISIEVLLSTANVAKQRESRSIFANLLSKIISNSKRFLTITIILWNFQTVLQYLSKKTRCGCTSKILSKINIVIVNACSRMLFGNMCIYLQAALFQLLYQNFNLVQSSFFLSRFLYLFWIILSFWAPHFAPEFFS